jgi:hypothetical protein
VTTSTLPSQRHRFVPAWALSLGIALTSALVVVPVAQASPRPALSAVADCRKVSSAAVSAIIGYKVPAPTADTISQKATKKNDEIASTETSCSYGKDTLAALPKDIILVDDVTSKPLTAAELKKGLAEEQKLKITFAAYSGLGGSYYYEFAVGGITIRGISVLKGVNGYGAFVYSKALPKSKLASLARLAEKL